MVTMLLLQQDRWLVQQKSFEAEPGSIRGDFGLGFTENIIHASDSTESFDKEVSVVFK